MKLIRLMRRIVNKCRFVTLCHYSYIHTVRRKNMPSGQIIEVKTQITHRDYINLLTQKDDGHFTIFKQRRCFLVNNQYFQLDIYQEPSHPRCRGLMLLETYSTLEEQTLLDSLPEFLDIEKEVTGNPDYSMYNLSLREDWTTSKNFWNSSIGDVSANEYTGTEVKVNGYGKKLVNGTCPAEAPKSKENV